MRGLGEAQKWVLAALAPLPSDEWTETRQGVLADGWTTDPYQALMSLHRRGLVERKSSGPTSWAWRITEAGRKAIS